MMHIDTHADRSGTCRSTIFAATAFGGLAALVFVVYSGIQRQNERSRQVNCVGNLTAIGTALLSYQDKYGHLPPAYIMDENGSPMHSWRVLILEFIDNELYRKYDFKEPWNGASNRLLADQMPSCFRCQNDSGEGGTALTSYVVVTGPHTAFPGGRGFSLQNVNRGTHNPILVVESTCHNIHWMEPRDLTFDGMSFVINDRSGPSIASRDPDGPAVCLSNGRVIRLQGWAPARVKSELLASESDADKQ